MGKKKPLCCNCDARGRTLRNRRAYLAAKAKSAANKPFADDIVFWNNGGQNLDSLENVIDLSNVKREPEDVGEMMEEERRTDNPMVTDFLQIKMEPQEANDESLSEIKVEVAGPGNGSNPNGYDGGRYIHQSKEYGCRFGECRKTFATEHEMQVHVWEHGTNMRMCYACKFARCGARFATITMAEKHVETHVEKLPWKKWSSILRSSIKTLFQCNFDGCVREFAKHQSLLNHARVHTRHLAYVCSAPSCMRFATLEELDRHIAAHATGDAFVCKFQGCGVVLKSYDCLRGHSKNMHSVEKPFKCRVVKCGRWLSTKFLFDVHARTHELLKRYVCLYEGCGKRYLGLGGLSLHMAEHRDTKCKYRGCKERFGDKETRERHTLLHTGDKPYPCTFEGCDARFVSNRLMRAHRRTHSVGQCGRDGCERIVSLTSRRYPYCADHGPTVSYRCSSEGCGATFEVKSRYETHMRFCQPKVNFMCEFEGCNEGFSEEDQFMEHYRNHGGVESDSALT